MVANTDILICYKDEVHIKIQCNDSIAREMQDYFTFIKPGSHYIKYFDKSKNKTRTKLTDGKVKLFHLRKMELYRGLIPYIEKFASHYKYTISYDNPTLISKNKFTHENMEEFASSLNLQSKGEPITPRDYQIEYASQAISNKRLLILSPTSSGKSAMIYLIIRALQHIIKNKILIIVPTTNLVEQLYGDFKDYSTKNKWDMRQCCKIYQGYEKYASGKIYISTWQSLQHMPEDYFHQFGAVIGDEAHGAKAKSLTHIIGSCINAKYRIGLTGTLDGIEVHKLVIEGLFGLSYRVITTRELIDRGEAAEFDTHCIMLMHDEFKPHDYESEKQYLIGNEKRNKFICKLSLKQEKNTLVLFERIGAHGVVLYEMLQKMTNRPIFFVHGGVDTEEIEAIRNILDKEDNAIILASYGKWSTGANIKNLHNIIFASPSKGRIRVLQSIGRMLRLNHNKDKAKLFDIADLLWYKDVNGMNYTLKHFMTRLQIYDSEKFPYQLYKVKI